MLRYAIPPLTALLLMGCEPAARCDRQISKATAAVDSAREAKSGIDKLSPELLKASALIASAEAKRISKDYAGCLDQAKNAINLARSSTAD